MSVGADHTVNSVPTGNTFDEYGASVQRLGNTPGHVNHWSRRGAQHVLARHGELVELRAPFPWTSALVRVG